jgi:tetratricopeptide (TPR) repeat protein
MFLITAVPLCESAIGKITTITHTVRQPFGGSQSPDDARIAAIAKAKREVLEMAGTYVESTTVVKIAQVEKDDIFALTAGVLKAEVVSQKNYHTEDAFGIEVVVKLEVDISILEERLKKLLQNRILFEQLKDSRNREKELLQKIAKIEKENAQPTKSDQESIELKKIFQETTRELTAEDLVHKALSLWVDEKISDPSKVIEYMSEAIRLNPDFAGAYLIRSNAFNALAKNEYAVRDADKAIELRPNVAEAHFLRGDAYLDSRLYEKAIRDYNRAITLKHNFAEAYNNRGLAYRMLQNNEQAIRDFSEAIRIEPNLAAVYHNRGLSYDQLGKYLEVIQDENHAISLDPNLFYAYVIRGNAYHHLGQFEKAFWDCDKAIQIQPNAMAFTCRGRANGALRQYDRSIRDCDQAILMDPNNADAYSIRGSSHFLSRRSDKEGCRSLQKACELGNCKAYETVKNSVCR